MLDRYYFTHLLFDLCVDPGLRNKSVEESYNTVDEVVAASTTGPVAFNVKANERVEAHVKVVTKQDLAFKLVPVGVVHLSVDIHIPESQLFSL